MAAHIPTRCSNDCCCRVNRCLYVLRDDMFQLKQLLWRMNKRIKRMKKGETKAKTESSDDTSSAESTRDSDILKIEMENSWAGTEEEETDSGNKKKMNSLDSSRDALCPSHVDSNVLEQTKSVVELSTE